MWLSYYDERIHCYALLDRRDIYPCTQEEPLMLIKLPGCLSAAGANQMSFSDKVHLTVGR